MNITRCEQHSDAGTWVLCPQCDLACRLPALSTGKKAVCPRCHSTLSMRWPDPRVRPTVYGISALLMLVLANLFPFISMHVAGINSEISLTRIPDIMVSDDFSALAFLFLMLVQVIPACCLVILLLLVNRIKMPHSLRVVLGRIFFHLRNWGMAEIFMAGVLVSFVKLMAYGEIGLGISFWPWCLFCILQLRAFQCVDKRQLWLHIQPELPVFKTPVAGVSGLAQGMRACPCCTAILPVDQRTCPRCFTRGGAQKTKSSMDYGIIDNVGDALCTGEYYAYYGDQCSGVDLSFEYHGRGCPSLERWLLPRGDGDLYRQHYGTNPENTGNRLA